MSKKRNNRRIVAGGNIGRTPTQTIILQPTRRGGLDVSTYMESIRLAEIIDYPRRAKLIDLYDDVLLDTHLFSVLRKQTASVLAEPIQFVRGGEVDEAMQEHIDSPWFGRFMQDLIESDWVGVGGSLFQFYLDEKGWVDYALIPRKHVDAIHRTILRNQTDLAGESWDNFSDLFYTGNPRGIGNLAAAAFWVILKRNNVADWAEMAELFGRPVREGTYDAWDEKAREKLIEDLYNMGGSGVILHPNGTNINLLQPASVSASGDLYEKFSTFCNNEISKAVNSNTLTTEAGEKGTQALGTVQQEGEDNIILFIKRRILNILNYEMTEIFASLGLPTGGRFVFVTEQKKDLTEQVNIDCRLRNELGLPLDHDELYERYGRKKPDNYDEQMAQRQQTTVVAAADRVDRVDPDEQAEELIEAEAAKERQARGILNRLRDFFGQAPADTGADLDW